MVINENNTHINSFTKGMNSDTAYDLILNSQYTFAKNIRITKNQSLGGASDYSTLREGIVTPVPAGELISFIEGLDNEEILDVKSVDNIGIIITTDNNDSLIVRRIDVNNIPGKESITNLGIVWRCELFFKDAEKKQVSSVLYKELDNVVKLYIATGIVPIIILRVDDTYKDKKVTLNVDYLINNRIVPLKRIYIQNVITGKLKTSQVLYTYRFYNKYGNTTQLAPITNKIQVIDSSRSKEVGNAENTETSLGFTLLIDCQLFANENKYRFEKLLIFRIEYIKPGDIPNVYLIYDDNINYSDSNIFTIDDVGIDPLLTLTLEEFSIMSGLLLIPKVIEQNQEYMFCSNVVDDTIIKDVEIDNYSSEQNINPVVGKIILSDSEHLNKIPYTSNAQWNSSNNKIQDVAEDVLWNISDYFEDHGVNYNLTKPTYNNIFTSSLLRSLRRGETYKYGIIYYDKYGRRSDVITLGTKYINEIDFLKNWTIPAMISGNELIAQPIGLKINIPQPKIEGKIVDDIIGCQIVRRSSSDIYLKTLLLVALSRPINQGLALLSERTEPVEFSPYYPSGFMCVNNMMFYPDYYPNPAMVGTDFVGDTRSLNLFQIYSSEINFRRNDVLSKLNVTNTKIKEVFYVPATYTMFGTITKESWLNELNISPAKFFGIPNGNFKDIQDSLEDEGSWRTIDYNTYSSDNRILAFVINCRDIPLNVDNIYFTLETAPDNTIIYFGRSIDSNNNLGGVINVRTGESNNMMNDSTFNSFVSDKANYFWVRLPEGYYDVVLTMHMHISGTSNNEQSTNTFSDFDNNYIWVHRSSAYRLNQSEKNSIYWVFNYCSEYNNLLNSPFKEKEITAIKDVIIPNWNDGFTNVQFNSDKTEVYDAMKKYKNFVTDIDKYTYNNWVSYGKYDLKPGQSREVNLNYEDDIVQEFLASVESFDDWRDELLSTVGLREGFIGPGSSCFLITTKDPAEGFPLRSKTFYTSICNITHPAKLENEEAEELTIYYGFGNYFPLIRVNGEYKTIKNEDYVIVFDGDIYITPNEFTTEYKTYNFLSIDTLQSTLITNYIPLESKVNTYFDYGMNLYNTNSANLTYEPGAIEGVSTLERPAHQYNMIYSDNDISNDAFTRISVDKGETNLFPHRTYFSELKNNGEFIDNFLIYKPASFIDVDSRYGQVTNLLTERNLLYYWQEHAFGKFSVNERSLINDTNGNTIMLGQAGILSRYDYISTKYGMREGDMCACPAAQRVFWIDINNKAIVVGNGEQAANYGELIGVQNIINNKMSEDRPYVHHDLLNDELLCKINNDEQVVFNTKYNMATSLYTRKYDDILNIKNHLYGIYDDKIVKYNYLTNVSSYLFPMQLDFVINPNASITKVFDSQLIVPIKRNNGNIDELKLSFETDLYTATRADSKDCYTDREGNIIYNIPRWGNEKFGNRIRGKWMKVDMELEEPTDHSALSHIITKFRQSFS